MDEAQVKALIDTAIARVKAEAKQEAIAAAKAEVEQFRSGFTIQNGTGISISGTGDRITISLSGSNARSTSTTGITATVFACMEDGAGDPGPIRMTFTDGSWTSFSPYTPP